MFDTMILAEKTFEMWPGALRLVALGESSFEAAARGYDMAREISASMMRDACVLAAGEIRKIEGVAGEGVRQAVEGMAGYVREEELPPMIAALPGAVCDLVMREMRNVGHCMFLAVSLGDVMTFSKPTNVTLPHTDGFPPLMGEFLRALPSAAHGGVALAGIRCAAPSSGLADRVAVLAASAAKAGFAAATMAQACDGAARQVAREARPRDRLYAQAWQGRGVIGETGHMEPEMVWDALGRAMNLAQRLREHSDVLAAIMTMKGRGRILGPIKGDTLFRFGVSEWR